MNYMTMQGLMKTLNIGKNKAKAIMLNEDIPSVKIGGKWFIEEQDLQDYLRTHKQIKLDYRGITKPRAAAEQTI